MFISLIISSILIYFNSSSIKNLQTHNLELKSNLNDLKYIDQRYREKFAQNIFSENRNISDVPLLNTHLDTVSLASLINNTKLIYRFYEETCVQCVEDELDIIKKLSDSIGANNILIISDFDRIINLKAIINRKEISSPFFNYKGNIGLPIEKDEFKIASFFLLHNNLRTQFVYKTGGEQNINDSYYKRIIFFFKEGY